MYLNHALEANPRDPRILLELDQLRKRKASSPADRLALLDRYPDVVAQRDDLTMEWTALSNCLGRSEEVLETIAARSFHPWEGGEGSIGEQYCLAHLLLGRRSLEMGDASAALAHFERGLNFPETLGEVPSDNVIAPLVYQAGQACEALGLAEEASKAYERVVSLHGWGPVAYYQALALRSLGRTAEAEDKLQNMLSSAQAGLQRKLEPNYFYQALPSPTFEDDLYRLGQIHFNFLAGLAHAGLGHQAEALTALEKVLQLDPAHILAWDMQRKVGKA